jgi:hypothetical protein
MDLRNQSQKQGKLETAQSIARRKEPRHRRSGKWLNYENGHRGLEYNDTTCDTLKSITRDTALIP